MSELQKYANFDLIGGQFKQAKDKYSKKGKELSKIVDDNTKDEKKELEDAFKKYNEKVKKITGSDNFKQLEKETLEHSNEMSKQMLIARNAFMKVREDIMKREDLSDKKKNKKINELFHKILIKFYSTEEMDEFKNVVGKYVNVVIPEGIGKQ